jgi:cobalt/nickel transport system ATP-binding protein
VEQDVAFGPSNLGLSGDAVRKRVERALTAVGMEGDGRKGAVPSLFRAEKEGSDGGRVEHGAGGARADEPSSNLDPRARREFGEILAGLSQTIVMVTHDLPYAHEICERAVIMDGGRIAADGPTDVILADADLLAAHDLELPHGFVMNHH